MNECNLTLSGNINLREMPSGLYVYGSLIVPNEMTEVVVKKESACKETPNVLSLRLDVESNEGPILPTPRTFFYHEQGPTVAAFTHVRVFTEDGECCTARLSVYG